MNVDQILDAIDELPPEDWERVKAHLAEAEQRPKPTSVEGWMAEFKAMADEIRGDSSDEEMQELFDAINLKSRPSEKGI